MDWVIPNVGYNVNELEFFVKLGLSWFPTMYSFGMDMYSVIIYKGKNEF